MLSIISSRLKINIQAYIYREQVGIAQSDVLTIEIVYFVDRKHVQRFGINLALVHLHLLGPRLRQSVIHIQVAVVGISAGPSFVQGFHDVGVSLFLIGAIATTLPLIIGLLLARYLFKFHPAIALGCCAGARTTTAALGAIQDAVESETPALGYTVTYAIGNTLLIIWGVVIVLLI